ncbi:MAG TPA: TfuA-related McrA-glycine thioamidation protein [Methanotrichaceae archaeon]|nr:TfuA-related McrA-glycine thioamidation protein [Methanotrichaceae archaeon]
MQPEVVVFLGPSLPEARAREILEADYRPPAKRGDLLQAAGEGAEIICLIDGVFFQECSVAHREVLAALDAGCRVIGASSMGALRASELDVYGMEGVGEIYRLYKSGELISDDEVALIFDPINFEPMSEPLVNIRHNLSTALENGFIDADVRDKVFRAAAALYFPDRNYERILNDAELSLDERARFEDFLARDKRDLKMEDALRALQRVKELI